MMVSVVRQGTYKSWNPGRVVFEGKDDNECLKFIEKNLEKYGHLYIDTVKKVRIEK